MPTTHVYKLAARLALILDDAYYAVAPTNRRTAPREWRKAGGVVEELRAFLVTGDYRYIPALDRPDPERAVDGDKEQSNAVADWILSHDRFADLYSVAEMADKYLAMLFGYRPKLVRAGDPSVTHQLLAALCRLLDRAPWPESQAERRPDGDPPTPFDPALRQMQTDIEEQVLFPTLGPIALVQGMDGPWIRLPHLLSLLEAILLRPDDSRHGSDRAARLRLTDALLPALDNAHDLYGDLCTLSLNPFEWMRRLEDSQENTDEIAPKKKKPGGEPDIPTQAQIRKAAAFKRMHLSVARQQGWDYGDRRALERAWATHTVTKFNDDLNKFLASPLGKAAAGFTKRDTNIPMEEQGEDGETIHRPADSIKDKDDEYRQRKIQDSESFRANTAMAVKAEILSAREAEMFLAIVEGEMTLDELPAAFADLLPGQKPTVARFVALMKQIASRLLPVIKKLEEQEMRHDR